MSQLNCLNQHKTITIQLVMKSHYHRLVFLLISTNQNSFSLQLNILGCTSKTTIIAKYNYCLREEKTNVCFSEPTVKVYVLYIRSANAKTSFLHVLKHKQLDSPYISPHHSKFKHFRKSKSYISIVSWKFRLHSFLLVFFPNPSASRV